MELYLLKKLAAVSSLIVSMIEIRRRCEIFHFRSLTLKFMIYFYKKVLEKVLLDSLLLEEYSAESTL